jgi:hypothetical protein
VIRALVLAALLVACGGSVPSDVDAGADARPTIWYCTCSTACGPYATAECDLAGDTATSTATRAAASCAAHAAGVGCSSTSCDCACSPSTDDTCTP